MSVVQSSVATRPIPGNLQVRTITAADLAGQIGRLESYVLGKGPMPLSRHPGWLHVLARGLGYRVYCLEATDVADTVGILPLAHVQSLLFGRFLVSLPYLNYGGLIADNDSAARLLIDRAVELADRLDVRYLELRHEWAWDHPSLGHQSTTKVHMRLPLARTGSAMWEQLPAKVRNQVRKGTKLGLEVDWGGEALLPEFYDVFNQNMRDLGTPVYGACLFREILRQFPDRAEICVIRHQSQAVAAGLLLHGWGTAEVPSASSLRRFNHTNANMLLYWCLLERAIQRGHELFDFGRCSIDSPTYRFKKQWGASRCPAEWQYYLRRGGINDVKVSNSKYRSFIWAWKKLPAPLTRLIGPRIIRGIP